MTEPTATALSTAERPTADAPAGSLVTVRAFLPQPSEAAAAQHDQLESARWGSAYRGITRITPQAGSAAPIDVALAGIVHVGTVVIEA